MAYHVLENAGYLLLILPCSMFCWASGLLFAGFLRDPADQRNIFRIAATLAGSMLADGPRPTGIAIAIVGVAFVNYVPILILIHNPYGFEILIVVLAYFLVHGIWLATVVRSIVRSRSRPVRVQPLQSRVMTPRRRQGPARRSRPSGPRP